LRAHIVAASRKKGKDIETVLRLSERPEQPWSPIVRNFVDHAPDLVNFLRSHRFNRTPPRGTVIAALKGKFENEKRWKAANRLPTRQIANAMAGVPSLGWRTSLDKCTWNPSPMLVGKRTEGYYRKVYRIPEPRKPVRSAVPPEMVPKPD
jgi:hypothetical protein